MAHEIEQMAYAGDQKPWHGLGVQVSPDSSPAEIQKAAGLNWTVSKKPLFMNIAGENIETDKMALVRDSDNTILTYVSATWNPVQNNTAFDFFADFVEAGDMKMDTAGSLKNGQIVWALAKVGENFTLANNDTVESYLLFSNPHIFGQTVTIKFVQTRVVCNNTLSFALSRKTPNVVNVNHRAKFDAEFVKETLSISSYKMDEYHQLASFLASRKSSSDDIVTYFKKVFPIIANDDSKKTLSKNAKRAIELVETQPGANKAPGTWWNTFNAATYLVDHELGRNSDNRLTSAWYGPGAKSKIKALHLAKDMAYAA